MKPLVKSGIQVFERLEFEALVSEKLKIKNFKLTDTSITKIKNSAIKEFAFLLLAFEEAIKQNNKDSIKEGLKYIRSKNKIKEWEKDWDPKKEIETKVEIVEELSKKDNDHPLIFSKRAEEQFDESAFNFEDDLENKNEKNDKKSVGSDPT